MSVKRALSPRREEIPADDVLELARDSEVAPVAAAGSRFKRALDLVLSLVMVTASAPLALVVALAIKLDDGGPVFYRQERWGFNGGLFRVFKFRTMIPESDRLHGILQAKHDDERVTRVGALLRNTGLDELPQILNILRGEMSFVGPRPLAVGELIEDDERRPIAYEDVPGFLHRLDVKPGLTGLATVYLPKDAHPTRKLEYDLRYIDEWSFWLDVKLITMSFAISFRGRWETREQKLRAISSEEHDSGQRVD